MTGARQRRGEHMALWVPFLLPTPVTSFSLCLAPQFGSNSEVWELMFIREHIAHFVHSFSDKFTFKRSAALEVRGRRTPIPRDGLEWQIPHSSLPCSVARSVHTHPSLHHSAMHEAPAPPAPALSVLNAALQDARREPPGENAGGSKGSSQQRSADVVMKGGNRRGLRNPRIRDQEIEDLMPQGKAR